MTYLYRVFKGLKYIVDHNTKMIHKSSNIREKCKISDNVEYINSIVCKNYEIYSYYIECLHCKKH